MTRLFSIAWLSFFLAFLSGTSLNFIQIFLELLLLVALIVKARQYDFSTSDLSLIIVFVWTCIIAFFSLDTINFLLQVKIYSLFLLVYFSCKNLKFCGNVEKLIFSIMAVNCLFVWWQAVFGLPQWIPINFFADFYRSQVDLRPVGIFLIPHPSAYFLGICAIYLFQTKRTYLKYSVLASCFATMSLTAALACSAQILMNRFGRNANVLFYMLVISSVSSYYFFEAEIMNFLMISSYTRYYSVGPILDQLVDTYYWAYLFNIFPKDLDSVMQFSETMYGLLGTEVDFIRHAIKIGFIFLFASYFKVVKAIPNYSIFVFLTMLHYSYFYTIPFMLISMFYFEKKLREYR